MQSGGSDSPQASPTDCVWKFGNASKLNPMRWSKPMSFVSAIKELESVKKDGNRPITLRVPSNASSTQRFHSCDKAIECLSTASGRPGSVGSSGVGHESKSQAFDPWTKYGLRRPLFMLPVDDDPHCEHSIEAVALAWVEGGDAVEVSVICKDHTPLDSHVKCATNTETQPICGRFIIRKGASGSFESITFGESYSGAQNLGTHVPKEMTKTMNLADFADDNHQTVVWVNVVHPESHVCLFGQKNTNTNLKTLEAKDYCCIDATHEQMKAQYQDLHRN